MAAQFDLEPRLAALEAMGLQVEQSYQVGHSAWLAEALDNCDVRAIASDDEDADNALVVVRLSFLENLLAAVEASLTFSERRHR